MQAKLTETEFYRVAYHSERLGRLHSEGRALAKAISDETEALRQALVDCALDPNTTYELNLANFTATEATKGHCTEA